MTQTEDHTCQDSHYQCRSKLCNWSKIPINKDQCQIKIEPEWIFIEKYWELPLGAITQFDLHWLTFGIDLGSLDTHPTTNRTRKIRSSQKFSGFRQKDRGYQSFCHDCVRIPLPGRLIPATLLHNLSANRTLLIIVLLYSSGLAVSEFPWQNPKKKAYYLVKMAPYQ